MSSHKLTKSHSENLSNNQIHLNGLSHKRSLTKQEEVDLTPDHHNSKHHPSNEAERSVKAVHSISICINNFEENSGEENMRQEMVRNVSEDTETSSLADGVKDIQIEDDDLRQSADTSALPLSDHCDAKDKKRTKHLVRCEAVRESSLSPPPPPPASLDANEVNSNKISFTTNHLTVYSNNKNVTVISKSSPLSKNGSSNSNSAASSPSLSRDSSTENTLECSGAELLAFLTESLKKSQKDRMYMLRIEQEIIQLIKDSSRESHKFSSGSSYNRMLIHRVAAYFGLEHNVDHTHTSVIVTKTKNAHIPELKLKELIKDDESTDEPKKLILKRDSTSLEDSSGSSFDKDRSPESHLNGSFSDSSRSRSLEEREENYERVRARIFNNSNHSSINEEQKGTMSPARSASGTSPSKATETTPKTTTGATEPKSSAEGGGEVAKSAADASAPKLSTPLETATSLETESQRECDKPKDALLPNNSASVSDAISPPAPPAASATAAGSTPSADAAPSAATSVNNNNNSKSSSSSSSHANENVKQRSATTTNSNGRYDRDNTSNRGRYGNMRNRGYSEQSGGGGGYHRYSQNRKMDAGNRGGGGDNGDWSLKPNLNTKLASQNMPYNFFYPPVVDGGPYGHRPFPPTLNHHAPVANQFSLGGNPYMQSPLLTNEQMPNNYQQFMQYSSMQPMCGPNPGVPYSPTGSNPLPLQNAAAAAAAYSSLMGMSPYQQAAAAYHQQQQHPNQHANSGPPMPLNLMTGGGIPQHANYKSANLNDYEKQLKSANGGGNYGKVPSMHQHQQQSPAQVAQAAAAAAAVAAAAQLNHQYQMAPGGQFCAPLPPSPEVLDRNALGQVQFNVGNAHMGPPPPELMMNSRAALHQHPAAAAGGPPFALNYGQKASRYPNDVLLGNPNQLSQQQQAQAQAAMYLSHQHQLQQQQQQQLHHQQKQYYGGSSKPNGAAGGGGGGGSGKFSNSGGRGGNGRRGGGTGGGGGGPNSNRKY